MKIAVTGATGHIGANLIPVLLQAGYQVRVIYRNERKVSFFKSYEIEKHLGDVLDANSMLEAFENVDVVIHLAGVISINGDPTGKVMKTNVEGVKNVVDSCLRNKVKKLIHFSSIHAFKYDRNTIIVKEYTPLADSTCFAYDQSKALGEKEVRKGIQQGLDAVILNPTGVIGPNDPFGSRSGDMFRSLFAGKLPALIKGGFDWIDVRDVVGAVVFILKNGNKSRKYILSGHWASLKKIAELSANASGSKLPKIVLPASVAILGLPFIKMQTRLLKIPPLYTYESLMIVANSRNFYSSELAKKELNFSPRMLHISIEDIFEDFKNKN